MNEMKKMGFPVCPDLSRHFHKKGQNHWILSSANTFALLYVDPPWPGWPACISCSTISWSDGDSFCRIIWSDSLSWISWMSSRPASLFLKRSGSPLRKIDKRKILFGGLVIHRHNSGKIRWWQKKIWQWVLQQLLNILVRPYFQLYYRKLIFKGLVQPVLDRTQQQHIFL